MTERLDGRAGKRAKVALVALTAVLLSVGLALAQGGPGGRGGRGGQGDFGGQGGPQMGFRMPPPAAVSAGNGYVYVVQGRTLLQYDGTTLDLRKQVELPQPAAPAGQPGAPTGAQPPAAN